MDAEAATPLDAASPCFSHPELTRCLHSQQTVEQGPTVGLIAPTLKLAFEEEDEPIVPITASTPPSSASPRNGAVSPTPTSPGSAGGTNSWTRRKSIRRPQSSNSAAAAPPTPAAAVAQAAKAKPATPAMRLDAHRNARLSLHQAKELCGLCAKEIRMRGELLLLSELRVCARSLTPPALITQVLQLWASSGRSDWPSRQRR